MKRILVPTLIVVIVLTSGCGLLPATPTATPEPTTTPTATATFTALPPTATATLTSVPTPTLILETLTPAATITKAYTNAPCVYSATVVSEDPQDSQEYTAEETFTKTWTLKNSGTCAWDGTSWRLTAANAPGDTEFTDASSYKMDELSSPKKSVVIVGDSITISLKMHAPKQWGTFTENWQLIDSDTNKIMAISYPNGTSGPTMVARIVVPESGSGGGSGGEKPTVEIQAISVKSGESSCASDTQYNIAAKIIGKARSQVSFTVSTDGNGTPQDTEGTATLSDKGGRDVNTVISGPYADAGNLQVTITVFMDGVAVNYASASICQDGAYQP